VLRFRPPYRLVHLSHQRRVPDLREAFRPSFFPSHFCLFVVSYSNHLLAVSICLLLLLLSSQIGFRPIPSFSLYLGLYHFDRMPRFCSLRTHGWLAQEVVTVLDPRLPPWRLDLVEILLRLILFHHSYLPYLLLVPACLPSSPLLVDLELLACPTLRFPALPQAR